MDSLVGEKQEEMAREDEVGDALCGK